MEGVPFTVGGQTYHVRFNARARYRFELAMGFQIQKARMFEFAMEMAAAGEGEEPDPDEILAALSDVEIPMMLMAGLEGERVATKSRPEPYQLDEVLDVVLADARPKERLALVSALLRAVCDAFRDLEGNDQEAADGEGKAPTA